MTENYRFLYGRGSVLSEGSDALLFSYGPVMLNEALTAAEVLRDHGFYLKVVNLPWLNRIDLPWFEETVGACDTLFVLDDHSSCGGLGDSLLNAVMVSDGLRGKRLVKFAVEDYPACGTPQEVLDYHDLSGQRLVTRILEAMGDQRRRCLEAVS